jgi:hypothetical protein
MKKATNKAKTFYLVIKSFGDSTEGLSKRRIGFIWFFSLSEVKQDFSTVLVWSEILPVRHLL